MSMPYPSTLPPALLEGYGLTAGEDTIRTEMEAGAARMRRRSFASPDRVKLGWSFDNTQMALFRAWFNGEIAGGSSWFTMTVDDGVLGYATPRDVRFVKRFEAIKKSNIYWQVSAEVEIRRQPLSALEHLNILGLPSLDLDFAGTQSLAPVITSAMQPAAAVTFTRSTTATYLGADGLIKTAAINEPRFDFDPVTHVCQGLLIEEARTNLYINSEAQSAGTGTTVTSNASVAPDGTTTADSVIETTANSEHYSGDRTISVTAGTAYVFSTFVNPLSAGSARKLYLRTASAAVATVLFNPATGLIETTSGADYLDSGVIPMPGGLTRVWLAVTAASTGTLVARHQLWSGSSIYTGDGVSGLVIWGGQVEAGAKPGSYIPTAGSAVTRGADIPQITGADFLSWYNAAEGTFVVSEYLTALTSATSRRLFSLSNGTTSERMVLSKSPASANTWFGVDGGGTSFSLAHPAQSSPGAYRSAVAYGLNSFASSADGAAPLVDTAGTVPSPSQIGIGHQHGLEFLNGHIARLTYYPKRLTNAQLQALSA